MRVFAEGCWNSIRQMGLLEYYLYCQRKDQSVSLFCQQYTSICTAHFHFAYIFSLTCPVFLFFFLSFLPPLVTAVDENTMHLNPFHSQKIKLRNTTGVYCWFQEGGEKREPIVQGFYCRDYSVRLDSESESWSRQPGPQWREERTEMIHLYCGSLRTG